MSVPALVVVVPLEGSPCCYFDALSAEEECRTSDWAHSHRDAILAAIDAALQASERDCARAFTRSAV